MSDSYQAIYDAARSRISNGDVGSAIRDVAFSAFDISHTVAILQQEFSIAAAEMQRPSAIYRPILSRDGDQWCARRRPGRRCLRLRRESRRGHARLRQELAREVAGRRCQLRRNRCRARVG
jgi:hypothetical protein